MTDQAILKKIQALPLGVKVQIIDFIEFLTHKYQLGQQGKKPTLEYGSLKGTFELADDFDEPSKDFKEYM